MVSHDELDLSEQAVVMNRPEEQVKQILASRAAGLHTLGIKAFQQFTGVLSCMT